MSKSKLLGRIIEDYFGKLKQRDDKDCPTITKKELMQEMEEADRLENCTVFATVDDFLSDWESDSGNN
jgi:hypothetical protein